MIKYMKALGGLLLASALVACGGGGGSAGTTTGGNTGGNTGGGTGTSVPATIDVFTSAAQLSTASTSSLTFTVGVKDASNNSIPNQTVTFSASSGSLVGALPSPATGAAGEPITSVGLSAGADRSNRSITVTVTAGSVSQQVSIPVTGTTLSVSGASSVLLNGTTSFTVKATDAAGQPVPSASLAATSQLGNPIAPATATTDALGSASFVYTGTNAGNDRITVSGLGTTATAPILVSAEDFSFTAPASNASIPVSTGQAVTVKYLVAGVPQVGKTVTFATTRGTVTPASAVTDATGSASAVVSSTSSGPANVVAQTASAQVTLPLNFVATNPATLVLQANPSALPPNTSGTSNQSVLLATVRDPSGNPVANKTVNFSAVSDPSNGTITPASATTDSSGTATAQFISGSIATANNGVQLQATVQGTAISGTTSLSVNAQALFITIGTGNKIGNATETAYSKDFVVYVTDATGAPAGGKAVTISVWPEEYLKGSLAYDAGAKQWTYSGAPTVCVNEDVNRNGILNAGEDTNGNGSLEPGLPVIIIGSGSSATLTTDSTGSAAFTLQYAENFAPWVATRITARASVGGTESSAGMNYFLAGSSDDFANQSVAPAGVVSPYGVATSCSNPN
jgi:hypothetical protein